MKKQPNFFSQMGNLTFYSPRNQDTYQEPQSMAEKSQKSFRNIINKHQHSNAEDHSNTGHNSTSHGPNARVNTLNEEMTRDLSAFDPDQLVTTTTIPEDVEPGSHRASNDIIRVIGASKGTKYSTKSPENLKLPSSPHFDLHSDKAIREETREHEESHMEKFYKQAQQFQNLHTTREKEDVAKNKLIDDKRNQAFSHLNAVRHDISHIFNSHKPSKSLSQTSKILNDTHQQQQSPSRMTNLLHEKGSGMQSPSEASNLGIERPTGYSFGNLLSYSIGPSTQFKLLDNSLQDSKFFSSPQSLNRRRHVVHGSLQKDIHSVQSPLSKNAILSHRSPRDKSPEPSAILPPGIAVFDQGEGSAFMMLKKELPSAFSNAPTNRQEVIQLGSWLSGALKGIQENKEFTGKEKFFKTDEVYNICFNELVRQVSLDCIERGELIMVIWKAYLSLSEDIIDDIKAREEKAEERGEKKCQKIHDMYNDILKAKEASIEELKAKLNESEEVRKELEEAAKTFAQRDAESNQEISKLKENFIKLKKNYQAVQQEHRDLQYKYQKLKKNFEMIEEDSEEPQAQAPVPRLSNLKKRADSDDFSLSSESEDTGRPPFAFGNVQHKVITYVDRSVVFEHPNGFQEIEIQTDLVLMNEQYNRIIATQETLDNFILEEAARVHLMQAAQLMENLAEAAPQEVHVKEGYHNDMRPVREVHEGREEQAGHSNESILDEQKSRRLCSQKIYIRCMHQISRVIS